MTPSETIKAELLSEIAHGAQAFTDPADFVAWLKRTGISGDAVSAVTGADKEAVRAKRRAGNPFADVSDFEYDRMSLPMTAEHYPGNAEVMRDSLFSGVLMQRLAEALDRPMNFLVAVYRALFGREPDEAGRAFYQGLLDAGVPPEVILRDMINNKAKGAT